MDPASTESAPLDYATLKAVLGRERLPCMLVDLDALDRNIARIAQIAQTANKKMRVASKSVRVPELLKRILDKGGASFQGLMCYSVPEAEFLSGIGFDDLLLAYPAVQPADLEALVRLPAPHAQRCGVVGVEGLVRDRPEGSS